MLLEAGAHAWILNSECQVASLALLKMTDDNDGTEVLTRATGPEVYCRVRP